MPECRISVLVVDDNTDLAESIGEFISLQPDMELAGAAYNGVAAIAMIDEEQPDVVVLDVIMPHLDGLGVIEHVRRMLPAERPKIVVVSAISSETTAASIVSAGADFYVAKPFDLHTLADRIRRITNAPPGLPFGTSEPSGLPSPKHSAVTEEFVLEHEVSRALRELGVPANLKGYEYLRDAVLMAIEQGHVMGNVTKVVYPAIASNWNTTPSRVERAIRHAIETAWIRGDINVLNDVFGNTVDAEKGRPTNSAFIARVADKIVIDMKTRR